MVDVDRWMVGLTPAHIAGLRCLSTRTAIAPSTTTTARNGLLSFSTLAKDLISHLCLCGVPIQPGFSDTELAHVEAKFSFTFPSDLCTFLSLGLPAALGFSDWHSRPLLGQCICHPLLSLQQFLRHLDV